MALKGKTTFELTDVNTGEVEVIEDTNMITEGLREFLDPCGSWGIYPFAKDDVRNTVVRKTLTGGIFLFNSSLKEDVANTYADASVKMVGNGAYGLANSSDVTEMGSFNETESGVQEDGSIKYVYDFTTSQANGTIQCVCLTSRAGGYMGYGNESGKSTYGTATSNDNYIESTAYQPNIYKTHNGLYVRNKSRKAYLCVMYAVYNEDAVYSVEPKSISLDNNYPEEKELHWIKTKNIRINKHRLGIKNVGLKDYNYIYELIASYDVPVPQEILDYMSAGDSSYYYNYVTPVADAHKKEIFVVFNKNANSVSNGSFFWVMKIDKDMQATAYKVTNNTGYNIYYVAEDVGYTSNLHKCAVDNDYLWCWVQKDGNYNLVGIKYSDSTQIIETDVVQSEYIDISKSYDHMLEFGVEYVNNRVNKNRDIFNVLTKKRCGVNGNLSSSIYNQIKIPFADKNGLYLDISGNSGNTFYLIKDPRYLATINNLSEPVVKTASKTMKVTYILTPEVDA